MKNKNLFLLPLFLLLPTATQCINEKQKTIQDIRNDRENIYKEREHCFAEHPLDYFLFQDNWDNFLYDLYPRYTLDNLQKKYKGYMYSYHQGRELHELIKKQQQENYKSNWQNLILPRILKKKGYSFLGLTAIALEGPTDIHIPTYPYPGPSNDTKTTLSDKRQASFHEKKEYIQLLLPMAYEIGMFYRVEIKPTPEDKEFALLEKWERCAHIIINKVYYFKHASLLSEIKTERKIVEQDTSLIQQSLIRYISLLMWESEESLF